MPTLPLGVGSYQRLAGRFPEIKLINRFLEAAPTNLRERTSLLSRPGTTLLRTFLPDSATGRVRGLYTKQGLFDSDLFVVSGKKFYRYKADTTTVVIQGEIRGTGRPSVTHASGIGYQRLFIADGTLLQYYNGGTHASNVLTYTPGTITTQKIRIGPTWYAWNVNVDTGPPDGSFAFPWLANPGADPIKGMEKLLNFDGAPGVDFSSALAGPNTLITALAAGGPPAVTLTVTARAEDESGNLIETEVVGDHLSWANPTLEGGGTHALLGIPMPNGDPPGVVATLNEFIFVSKAGSNRFYFIRPGETTIDPLDFFTKESAPDAIVDFVVAGDVLIVFGRNSTETWYATGENDRPFAPLRGRTLPRGAVPGTPVLVEDVVVLVGSDGIVYTIGGSSVGQGAYAPTAIRRVSTHGIEERIQRQLRREAGLIT